VPAFARAKKKRPIQAVPTVQISLFTTTPAETKAAVPIVPAVPAGQVVQLAFF